MADDDKSKKGNNGGGKSRKRRPAGYPERHAKAQEWLAKNPNAQAILQGRTPDYEPKYCLDVLYGGKMGRTLTQIARDIGVHRVTMQRWAAKYEDFRIAVDISKEWRQSWLEDMAMGQISGTIKGNSGMLRFALINTAPDEYADIKVIEARLANKPADEPPPIDFNQIPLDDRIVLMEAFRKTAKAHLEHKPGDGDIVDAEIIEETKRA